MTELVDVPDAYAGRTKETKGWTRKLVPKDVFEVNIS